MTIDERQMLPIGTLLKNGEYRIERYIASGGFGNTYEVEHVKLGKRLALKEFFMRGVNLRKGLSVTVSQSENEPAFDQMRKKFYHEAQRLATMDEMHIVEVSDFFEENETAYYVMKHIDGCSLSVMLKQQGRPFTEDEVRLILPQVLSALEYVHARGLYHLDLKPGNIMMDGEGHCWLIDFGASKQVLTKDGLSKSMSKDFCYTEGFAPMEQVCGSADEIGPWTDFYALGATMYNLLTGKIPPSSYSILNRQTSSICLPASVSVEMRQLIEWMMRPLGKDRPQNVKDIQQRIQKSRSSRSWWSWMGKFWGNHSVQGSEATIFDEATDLDNSTIRQNSVKTKRQNSVKTKKALNNTSTLVPKSSLTQVNEDTDDITIAPNNTTIKTSLQTKHQTSAETKQIVDTPTHAEEESNSELPEVVQFLIGLLMFAAIIAGVYYMCGREEESEDIKLVAKADDPILQNLIDNMVYVEGGTFWMGAQNEHPDWPNYDYDARDEEKPVHQVTLSSFWIGRYEVTQEEWELVMGNNPSEFPGKKHPVEEISWDDCQAFIRKLNEKTGLTFRFPTEAEWEYAGRGGKNQNSYKYSGSNNVVEVAWCDSDEVSFYELLSEERLSVRHNFHTNEIGQLAPNSLGIYDMSGNVSELCQDWADNDYYSISPVTNPCCNDSGSVGRKIIRGGGYYNGREQCRLSYRYWFFRYSVISGCGLRLAMDYSE